MADGGRCEVVLCLGVGSWPCSQFSLPDFVRGCCGFSLCLQLTRYLMSVYLESHLARSLPGPLPVAHRCRPIADHITCLLTCSPRDAAGTGGVSRDEVSPSAKPRLLESVVPCVVSAVVDVSHGGPLSRLKF